MSLTGLFLITFLPVHLLGNIQLLWMDEGVAFNTYAKFMTGNPLILFISLGLYFFILLHTIQGILIWLTNKSSKGTTYAVKGKNTSFASRNMGPLGTIILIFILIHMYQFWLKMKIPGGLEMVTIDGVEMKNLFVQVVHSFSNLGFVVFYVLSMVAIGFHLSHGFQSAFQTLGLNHKKYTPLINGIGTAYSILIPLGFAAIPIIMYIQYA